MELSLLDKVKEIVSNYYRKDQQKVTDKQEIKITQMYSLANDVFQVSTPDHPDILVKIYHKALLEFTDSLLEIRIVKMLSQQHKYPTILHSCQTYRIEQFIHSNQVNRNNFGQPQLLQTAQQLADYACNFKSIVEQYNHSHKMPQRFKLSELQIIFWKIYQQKMQQCPLLVKQCQQVIESVFGRKQIMQNLQSILSNQKLILSHNDCHLGNFLNTGSKVIILDFQFSQFNYIGFDLGNFFNEWATEYTSNFNIHQDWELPEQIKQKMIKTYFQTLRKGYEFNSTPSAWSKYIRVGRALSHLFWMIIGLKQINDSRIEFSMVKYIKLRAHNFLHWLKVVKQSS